MDTSNKKEGPNKQWTRQQDLWYYFALILCYQSWGQNNNKKATRLFKQLQKLLPKSSKQCRTHHGKKIVKIHKSIDRKDHFILYKFYYEEFIIRRTDEKQLRKEIKLYLEEIFQPAEQGQRKYTFYMKKLERILAKLSLEENSRKYFDVKEEKTENAMNAETRTKVQKPQTLDNIELSHNLQHHLFFEEESVPVDFSGSSEGNYYQN